MKAIQIEEFGGPDVMRHVEIPDPVAGEGEVVIDVARSGINFADTHATRNDYLAEQQLPLIPGAEVSGRTADGRRVASILSSGGYAEKVAAPEGWLVPIPDEVDNAAPGSSPARPWWSKRRPGVPGRSPCSLRSGRARR
jgi:NADPH2:quinone reductase